jgi:hypothetical protein
LNQPSASALFPFFKGKSVFMHCLGPFFDANLPPWVFIVLDIPSRLSFTGSYSIISTVSWQSTSAVSRRSTVSSGRSSKKSWIAIWIAATRAAGLPASAVRTAGRIDDSRLAELFGREVLGCLVRKQLLVPEWAERILSWRHTDFNVHSRVRAKTKTEAERVGKYIIRRLGHRTYP